VSRKRIPICGLLVPTIGAPRTLRSHLMANTDVGTAARVSESTAKYLTTAFGRRMPRPGSEVQLCDHVFLSQGTRFGIDRDAAGSARGVVRRRGQYEITKSASAGALRGGKKRRR